MLPYGRLCLRSGFLLLFLVPLLAPANAACGDVRLNEICAAPARDWNADGAISARDDEWIEIVNTGPLPVPLAGFLVSDADSTWRWGGGTGELAAGGRLVVFGLDAVNWERANGFGIFGLSLANAGDMVRLWQVVGTDTLLVDSYGYRAHEAGTDRSVGRLPDGTGGWALFDAFNPYTGTLDPKGTSCAPTLGAANACPGTSAEPSSWGRLKSLYH